MGCVLQKTGAGDCDAGGFHGGARPGWCPGSVVGCQLLREGTSGGRRPLLAGAMEPGVLLDATLSQCAVPSVVRQRRGG